MKKIITLFLSSIFYFNTSLCIFDFANRDAHLAVNQAAHSLLRLGKVASITGWPQDSIVNDYGNNISTSWVESYTNNVVLGTGRRKAPSNMVYNNSNTVATKPNLATLIIQTSNALTPARLLSTKNNSNAINAFAVLRYIKNNSSAVIGLNKFIRTDSNTLFSLCQYTTIRNNSNVIVALGRLPKQNSNAITSPQVTSLIRGNSNLINIIGKTITGNSNAVNAINTAAILSLIINTSNAINASYPFNDSVQIIRTRSTFLANTTINQLISYQGGITINAGKTLTLNTPFPISGFISLNSTGKLSLGSDIYLSSNTYLSQGGDLSGNGYSLVLSNSIVLPGLSTLKITSNTTLDGRGNRIYLQPHAQIMVDSNVSLTIKNMTIQTTRNNPNIPIIKCLTQQGNVTLDNVTIQLADDFPFRVGRLFFNNDVTISGTSRFIYQSWMQSYVMPQSLLTFEPGTTLYYYPSSTNKDLIQLTNQSSGIYLLGSGTTLQTTLTGMRLTKGRLWLDNKVTLSTSAATALDLVTQVTAINYGSIANSVAWSPNRRYLAVGGSIPNGGNEVQIYRYNGTTLTLVTSLDFGGNCLRIKWSPDGRYLAAVGGPSNNFKVYSFNGTTLTQIAATTDGTGNMQGLDWSRDGTYIAIGPVNATSTFEIRVYSFNGSSLTNIAGGSIDLGATAGTLASGMSWNPLGTILAIGANSSVTGGNEIRLYTWNGTTLTLKTSVDYGAANGVNYIEFDPSGLNVAVGGQGPTNSNELQIYRFNGSTLLLVTSVDYGTAVNEVHWDPSGRYLAVGGTGPTNSNELQFYKFDGTSLSLITSNDYGTAINGLSWSADGATIAVGGQTATAGHNEIEVYNIAYRFDTSLQALTNGINFGNSALGSTFDLNVYVLAGARAELDGLLFYNNVN
ncbi:WD40 repeat domain-containing protein [bacterium]|nr:MAG: WD40 repeat domain-containing protein [bacterium]